MEILREDARAKVNLTLKVLGKRPDGYHEISSLAVFAGIADQLTLTPSETFSLDLVGPFATALSGRDNLVEKATSLFLQECPGTRTGAFMLEKNIPVAAGLGGGSADAAAALRLLARANPGATGPESLKAAATRLGSDVAVCLESRAALMRGRGDEVAAVGSLPMLPGVLVNPGVALGAGEVYQALDAPVLDHNVSVCVDELASPATIDGVARYICSAGNDLQAAAMKLAPVIGEVLTVLEETKGCLAAQMSGSGSTCFAVYPDGDAAESAAAALTARYPRWWIRKTELD